MNAQISKVAKVLDQMELKVATKQRDRYVIQTFSGALRIKPGEVFVGSKEGRRALKELKDLAKKHPKADAA